MKSSAKELGQIETTQKAENTLRTGTGIRKNNLAIGDSQNVRSGAAHTEKDGGKAKTAPETLKDRGLEAHMKVQRNYVLILKHLDK